MEVSVPYSMMMMMWTTTVTYFCTTTLESASASSLFFSFLNYRPQSQDPETRSKKKKSCEEAEAEGKRCKVGNGFMTIHHARGWTSRSIRVDPDEKLGCFGNQIYDPRVTYQRLIYYHLRLYISHSVITIDALLPKQLGSLKTTLLSFKIIST